MRWTERTLAAYVAGLIDGEGTIGLNIAYARGKGTGLPFRIRVALFNTNEDVLRFVQAHFGGGMYARSRQPRDGAIKTVRPCWQLVWQSAAAERFLKQIEPYVIVKKPQLVVALAIRARMAARLATHGQDHSWIEPYRARMKQLNQRGSAEVN